MRESSQKETTILNIWLLRLVVDGCLLHQLSKYEPFPGKRNKKEEGKYAELKHEPIQLQKNSTKEQFFSIIPVE
jgi:hypothetical protein